MSLGESSMRLNREDSRWLGVCAGIADWLDVPPTLVRIVFIICVLAWPPLILGYICLYFCMDRDFTPERMQDYFRNAKTAEHFRQLDYRKPIYKNQRNKRVAGVCAGIADYLEISTFSVRALTLLSLFLFGPFTFWAYIVCIFVFDDDPNASHSDRAERRYTRKQRRKQRWQDRAERIATRQARRRERWEARRTGRRKSYLNEEFEDDIHEFEEDLNEAVDDVKDDISAEVNDAVKRARESGARRGKSKRSSRSGSSFSPKVSRKECTEAYNSMEMRLREIEAYMTSKKFRLHCEINRISIAEPAR